MEGLYLFRDIRQTWRCSILTKGIYHAHSSRSNGFACNHSKKLKGVYMLIRREWAMPNKNTFSIKPIRFLIDSYFSEHGGQWADPFSRNSPYNNCQNMLTNDLDPNTKADSHMEALDFLKTFKDSQLDGVLFDPPYSPRQISECYKSVGKAVHMKDTQSSFYGDRKAEVARIVNHGGIVISFGWNSGGIGKTLGFEIVEILLVAHGGAHNDTICTVERKVW